MGVAESKLLAQNLLGACRKAENEGKVRLDGSVFWNDDVCPFPSTLLYSASNNARPSRKLSKTFADIFLKIYVAYHVKVMLKRPSNVLIPSSRFRKSYKICKTSARPYSQRYKLHVIRKLHRHSRILIKTQLYQGFLSSPLLVAI